MVVTVQFRGSAGGGIKTYENVQNVSIEENVLVIRTSNTVGLFVPMDVVTIVSYSYSDLKVVSDETAGETSV